MFSLSKHLQCKTEVGMQDMWSHEQESHSSAAVLKPWAKGHHFGCSVLVAVLSYIQKNMNMS